MNQVLSEDTRVCGKCHRKLPFEAFYFNKKTQTPDCYCKKCHGECNRMVRKKNIHPQGTNHPRCYLVLTRIEDREQRLKLILHALQVVNESIARKRRRIRETIED